MPLKSLTLSMTSMELNFDPRPLKLRSLFNQKMACHYSDLFVRQFFYRHVTPSNQKSLCCFIIYDMYPQRLTYMYMNCFSCWSRLQHVFILSCIIVFLHRTSSLYFMDHILTIKICFCCEMKHFSAFIFSKRVYIYPPQGITLFLTFLLRALFTCFL